MPYQHAIRNVGRRFMGKKKKAKKKAGQLASGSAGARLKAGKKVSFPRLAWSRSPVQRPHSTKKGAKGYDRKRLKREDQEEAGEGA